jgi:hypothetical protein
MIFAETKNLATKAPRLEDLLRKLQAVRSLMEKSAFLSDFVARKSGELRTMN